MSMFGLRIVTRKKYAQIKQAAYDAAIADIIELLKNKDNIYLEPVALHASSMAQISNNAFLGAGLEIHYQAEGDE